MKETSLQRLILYNYMAFWKRQHCEDNKKISDGWAGGGGWRGWKRWTGQAQDIQDRANTPVIMMNKARNVRGQTQAGTVLNIHWKHWCWSWSSTTVATWCEEDSLEKTLMLGKIEGRRRRGRQRMRWLDGITDPMNVFEQSPGVGDGRGGWRAAVHGVAKSQTRLSDWTDWRRNTTTREPWINSDDNDVSGWVPQFWQMDPSGGGCWWWRRLCVHRGGCVYVGMGCKRDRYGKSLYLPLNFVINLKLF